MIGNFIIYLLLFCFMGGKYEKFESIPSLQDDLPMQLAYWKGKCCTKQFYLGGLGPSPQEILKFNA